MENIIISTTRLVIFPLTYEQLHNYLYHESIYNQEIGPISREILTENLYSAIEMKLSKLKKSQPEHHPWITYWLMKVLSDD